MMCARAAGKISVGIDANVRFSVAHAMDDSLRYVGSNVSPHCVLNPGGSFRTELFSALLVSISGCSHATPLALLVSQVGTTPTLSFARHLDPRSTSLWANALFHFPPFCMH